MSIPVDIAHLSHALADFGAGYLLSTSADGRVKAVTVEPEVHDGVLLAAAPGRGSCANISANAQVTVLFAPLEARGYTLLVDGTAEILDDDARITPTHAVLHRPASHSDGPGVPGGCGNDCLPVE